jgi:hypothetical protein
MSVYSYLYSDFYNFVNTDTVTQYVQKCIVSDTTTWPEGSPSLVNVMVDWNVTPTVVNLTFDNSLSDPQKVALDSYIASYVATINIYVSVYINPSTNIMYLDDGNGNRWSLPVTRV